MNESERLSVLGLSVNELKISNHNYDQPETLNLEPEILNSFIIHNSSFII